MSVLAELRQGLLELEGSARDGLAACEDVQAVLRLKGEILGKKRGRLASLQARMRDLDRSDRPEGGKILNRVKDALETAFGARLAAIERQRRLRALRPKAVDVTLPGRRPGRGSLHVLTQTRTEIERIFIRLGFDVCEGPEVETDWHNFEALGMPEHHPARDMQDTFFVAEEPESLGGGGQRCLRTHTSPVQIRTMLGQQPPVRMICPGGVYRRDDDPTHSPNFMQVEGLYIDTGVTFGNLKWILGVFARELFGPEVRTRFRPSFFPFTEPSAEVDLSCVFCSGSGMLGDTACGVCKETGWMEILGCGMVDPVVLGQVKYDAEKWTGYAFGMGIDRIAMLRYGIPDIRLLYENDLRLLAQF